MTVSARHGQSGRIVIEEKLLRSQYFLRRLCLKAILHTAKVINCIVQLKNYDSLGRDDVIKLTKSLFHSVTVQTLVQADRMTVYNVIEHLLVKRLSGLLNTSYFIQCHEHLLVKRLSG